MAACFKIKNYLFFFLLIFGACKDKVTAYPEPIITFLSPSENSVFSEGDSISVSYNLSSVSMVESIEIGFSDANGIQVNTPQTYLNSEISQSMQSILYVENLDYSSDNYFIYIRVRLAQKTYNFYRRVYLKQLPLRRRAIYIIQKASGQYRVDKIDSLNTIQSAYYFNGDYIGSAMDSRHQVLTTCGLISGKLLATDLKDYSTRWYLNTLGQGYPTFRNILFSKGLVFVSFMDGKMKGFDEQGSIMFSSSANQGVYFPIKLGFNTLYLLSEQQSIVGAAKKLVLYKYPTGKPQQEFPISGDVVSILPKNDNAFFVFSNEQNEGKIKLYDCLGNGFTFSYSASLAGKITHVAAIDGNEFIVAASDGIYSFTYNPLNFVKRISVSNVSALAFDSASNQFFVCTEKRIDAYDGFSFNPLNSLAVGDSIVDIQLLYNR